jgi:hypothetical protein
VAWIKAALLVGRTGRPKVIYGLRQRLADRFGVSYWCIESIDKTRRWRDVRPKRWGRGT